MKVAGAGAVSLDDLSAAVQYLNESYERDVQLDQLRWKRTVMMAPRDFVDDASHLGNRHQPAGWLKEYPESEWLDELRSAYSRDFGHIQAVGHLRSIRLEARGRGLRRRPALRPTRQRRPR